MAPCTINNNRPRLIVLTPVRNEFWILRAFLEATSCWADQIIIADQNSTDGSKELYNLFPKVIVVENDTLEMNQSESRKLLLGKAKEILNGDLDAILFALDADEILSGDFLDTNDWRKIINSKPNDAFCWRWMNLKEGDPNQYSTFTHYYWAVHVSEEMWEGQFPNRVIHEWRLPWVDGLMREIFVEDFCSIHFARVNTIRQRNKERFYQVTSLLLKDRYDPINIYRQYHDMKKQKYYPLPSNAYEVYRKKGLDILNMINFCDEGAYYSAQVIKIINQHGITHFSCLDIWTPDWCKRFQIENPQRWYHRLLMLYLRITNIKGLGLYRKIERKILAIRRAKKGHK